LAVAGILMLRPRVFVVDEPLANLDPATAERLLTLLRTLADQGSAIVIVEHRVEECLDLRPDRVLYLEAGVTRYLGEVNGFLDIADPESVKLPFEVVVDRVAAGLPDEEPPATTLAERGPTPNEGTARLEFQGVTAALGGHEILHGVDARFGPRETVAVLGPNGSGKTTMFRTAMRLLQVTGGAVLVDGASIADKRTTDLVETFGYVFQSPSQMLFNRTVVDELLFGPRTLGHDEATFDELIDDVLRRTSLADLEDIRERPPLAMSFGQQKRLALAIALALRPSTLILDEPSAGQDHRTAQIFMREVAAIPGLESLYFVTHDVDLALTHADRILLFRDGRVIADGSPMEVIADTARWRACDLRVTSLMEANARYGSVDGKFLDADTLARRVIAQDPTRRHGPGREAAAGGLLTDH
jgi:energy-coupling factor transport system ATP-binding protein